MYDRKLLTGLSKCAWKILGSYLKHAVPHEDAVAGGVIAVQTFGDFQNFNPHLKQKEEISRPLVKNERLKSHAIFYGISLICLMFEALAKLFVIPECFYPRYKHSGTDMVFQAVRTRFPLRIAAGMTELGLLQEPRLITILSCCVF